MESSLLMMTVVTEMTGYYTDPLSVRVTFVGARAGVYLSMQ